MGFSFPAQFYLYGLELYTNAVLDYEELPRTFRLTITASDGTSTGNLLVDIAVADRNDAPVITSAATSSVAEKKPAGTQAYLIQFTDQDAGDSHTFGVTPSVAGTVSVASSTCTCWVGVRPPREWCE